MSKEIIFKQLSFDTIGVCLHVHSVLGPGLPEICYNKALLSEFSSRGIACSYQESFDVSYKGIHVGFFRTDLVVDNKIIVELKVAERITVNHESQLFTYLKTTGLKVGYVVNFGLKKLEFKRLVM